MLREPSWSSVTHDMVWSTFATQKFMLRNRGNVVVSREGATLSQAETGRLNFITWWIKNCFYGIIALKQKLPLLSESIHQPKCCPWGRKSRAPPNTADVDENGCGYPADDTPVCVSALLESVSGTTAAIRAVNALRLVKEQIKTS